MPVEATKTQEQSLLSPGKLGKFYHAPGTSVPHVSRPLPRRGAFSSNRNQFLSVFPVFSVY